MKKDNRIKFDSSYIGKLFKNNRNETFKILEDVDRKFYLIEFQDEFKFVRTLRKTEKSFGVVTNPYYRLFNGIGYIGVGDYQPRGNAKEAFIVWRQIYIRVGNTDIPRLHTYVNCSIDERWNSFQSFAEWFYNNPFYQKGWQLDKDMAVFGNRTYGPDTCCFLPRELNGFQTSRVAKSSGLPRGVHKTYHKYYYVIKINGKNKLHCGYDDPNKAALDYQEAKSQEAKRLAVKYEGKIDPRVIYNLNNLRVVENGS